MLNLTERQKDLWPWFVALWAWDYNDPKMLTDLFLGSGGHIPAEFLPIVAEIISGTRKPNKKAGAKLLIPASELGKLAGSMMIFRDLSSNIAKHAIGGDPALRGVHAIAKQKGKKPIEVTRELQGTWREAKEKAALKFRVDLRTIERIVAEADERIRLWPNF